MPNDAAHIPLGKSSDARLLPCGNCGGEAEFRSGSSTMPYIRCKMCGMRTGSSWDKEKLIETWNRRYERTCHIVPRSKELGIVGGFPACSECGVYMHYQPYTGKLPKYCPNCGARVIGGKDA